MDLYLELFLHFLFSLFAVFGFYCALRALSACIFTPKNLVLAVEVRTENDAEQLDLLLQEAYFSFRRRGRSRIVVLISTDLMKGIMGQDETLLEQYEVLVDRYGAECYLIDMD